MRRTFLLLLGLLGCGESAATEARPACVPAHPRICGLAPAQRPVPDGLAYDVATVTGERLSVVLPAGHGVVAVPSAALPVNADLTTAAPREAADRFCDGFAACRPVPVRRTGRVSRWDDASGTIRDLGVTTVDHGDWTLVLAEPSEARARRVVQAVSAGVGADGFPRLSGAPLLEAWAGVAVWVDDVLVDVRPGCDAPPDLVPHPPDTAPGGSWCEGGRYAVDVSFAAPEQLERLRATLRIIRG